MSSSDFGVIQIQILVLISILAINAETGSDDRFAINSEALTKGIDSLSITVLDVIRFVS